MLRKAIMRHCRRKRHESKSQIRITTDGRSDSVITDITVVAAFPRAAL